MNIEWETPPPRGGGKQGSVQTFIAALRERPGEWAKYPHVMKTPSCAGTYNAQYGEVEWTSRRRQDGSGYDLYGRAQ